MTGLPESVVRDNAYDFEIMENAYSVCNALHIRCIIEPLESVFRLFSEITNPRRSQKIDRFSALRFC